jgi:hypothetical protein
VDPTFRMLASRERRGTSVALTSTLHWSETEVLTEADNYQGLARLDTDVVQGEAMPRRVILDIDSSESSVHGAQEQSSYNGHFKSFCYHPLFVFNQKGDCLAAKLRRGNVPSASGWEEVLLPVIDRHQDREQRVVVHADAAFALPRSTRHWSSVAYAIRLPANQVLERAIEDLLARPRGRPSHAPLVRYRSFHYQAASWDRPRRVVAKVEHHLGELFPRVGFIEVRLLLGVIAYNLGSLLRKLALPLTIQNWSLTSLQQRLFKTGIRLIRHARYFTLQLAESYLTGPLFRQIVAHIERLAWHPT